MESWQSALQRWTAAGLLDPLVAERIRTFEGKQARSGRLRWPVMLAIGLGAVMVGAGVLLFVGTHWDELSPTSRFVLVLLLVAGFHVAGAFFQERFATLATGLHGIGTVALGAGIYLTAQIFNLQAHWPTGVLLWAAGAWLAYWFRRDWPQAALAALLTPAWVASEWGDYSGADRVMCQGLLLLAIVYFTARTGDDRSPVRAALVWMGGIALIPLSVVTLPEVSGHGAHVAQSALLLAFLVAMGLPLATAYFLGRLSWAHAIAAVWVALSFVLPEHYGGSNSALGYLWHLLGNYLWVGAASIGLIAWGLKDSRRERINLGVLGFALTVGVFYFVEFMDQMGRSAALVAGGLAFLLGGWYLERLRRRLVARVKGAAA